MNITDKALLKDLKIQILNEKISKLRAKFIDYDTIAHNNSVLYDNIEDEIRVINLRKDSLVEELEEANDLLIEFSNKRDELLTKINKKINKRNKLNGYLI